MFGRRKEASHSNEDLEGIASELGQKPERGYKVRKGDYGVETYRDSKRYIYPNGAQDETPTDADEVFAAHVRNGDIDLGDGIWISQQEYYEGLRRDAGPRPEDEPYLGA